MGKPKRAASEIERTAHNELLFEYGGFKLEQLYQHGDFSDTHSDIFKSTLFVFKKSKQKSWDQEEFNKLLKNIQQTLDRLQRLPMKSDGDKLLHLSIVDITIRFHLFFLSASPRLLLDKAEQFNKIYDSGLVVLEQLDVKLYSHKQFRKVHAHAVNSTGKLLEAGLLDYTEFNQRCSSIIKRFLDGVTDKETGYEYVSSASAGTCVFVRHKKQVPLFSALRATPADLGLPPLLAWPGMLVAFTNEDAADTDLQIIDALIKRSYEEMLNKRQLLNSLSLSYHSELPKCYEPGLFTYGAVIPKEFPTGITQIIEQYIENFYCLDLTGIGQLLTIVGQQITQLDKQLYELGLRYCSSEITLPEELKNIVSADFSYI